MNYHSTRSRAGAVISAQAIAQGLCGDGGLFVPEQFPAVSGEELEKMQKESYQRRAERILSKYLTDFSKEEIRDCVSKAYRSERFPGGPAPVVRVGGGVSFLELWHGPTCAFKDMALQILPHLLTKSLKKIGTGRKALILVATSGDTGKAALEGFQDVPETEILVFYPKDGVSRMQERQMLTQEGKNVAVCAVEGNFDDAQTGVKQIFGDRKIRERLAERGLMFSSANSINWGRLLPQIVYYFSAYCDLCAAGEIRRGEPVNFAVPTGNFGDILAAYYAKKMGLPVKKLICASNSNNVLTDFLTTGVYSRNRKFYTTISPSMDILVSSNLERLLYDLTGRNAEQVAGWMNRLNETGEYRVDEKTLAKIRELFHAGFCGDEETREEIKSLFQSKNYLCDPHTSVAARVYREYRDKTGDDTPTVIVSTASPYKFASEVLKALGEDIPGENEFAAVKRLSALTGASVSAPIAALESKTVRFSYSCKKEEMSGTVLKLTDSKFV
ncbi:threonine synthase [Caproicibacter sp. BJN0012]|uniref:threonine synthase n=1 Tax=Caproicibacter sp. BJN0012 TaxID=3110227 RepID=UPI002E114010|nr:threonine synthase [Caproicibacter sp. BJN0012]